MEMVCQYILESLVIDLIKHRSTLNFIICLKLDRYEIIYSYIYIRI